MKEKDIKTNSARAWMLASRPKTLAGAAVPMMIGLSAAYRDVGSDFNIVAALLCVAFAFIMQIDANFINDYFDFVKGTDDDKRLGPRRACAQGWITTSAMKRAIAVTTVLACMAGLPLVLYGGLEMILVGAVCVLFCFLYTTSLSYLGLGDALVLVFFGIVPICVTYYIQAETVTSEVLLASVSCGLVIDTLLIVNNYRDIDNDRRAGKKTLVVRVGADMGRKSYLITGILAVLVCSVFLFKGHVGTFLSPFPYLIFHYITYRKMVRINKGKALNAVLGDTARNMFIYGLLLSVGILFLG